MGLLLGAKDQIFLEWWTILNITIPLTAVINSHINIFLVAGVGN